MRAETPRHHHHSASQAPGCPSADGPVQGAEHEVTSLCRLSAASHFRTGLLCERIHFGKGLFSALLVSQVPDPFWSLVREFNPQTQGPRVSVSRSHDQIVSLPVDALTSVCLSVDVLTSVCLSVDALTSVCLSVDALTSVCLFLDALTSVCLSVDALTSVCLSVDALTSVCLSVCRFTD